MHSFPIFLFIGNIEKQLLHPGVSLTKLIDDISLVIGKKNLSTIKVQSKCNQYRSLKGTFFFCFLFFHQGFISHTLAFNRTAGEGRGPFFFCSSIPPTDKHLDIYFAEMSNVYF